MPRQAQNLSALALQGVLASDACCWPAEQQAAAASPPHRARHHSRCCSLVSVCISRMLRPLSASTAAISSSTLCTLRGWECRGGAASC